jgi:hypothetical protein
MAIGIKVARQESKESSAYVRRDARPTPATELAPGPAAALLNLQRTHGNRFVQRLLVEVSRAAAGGDRPPTAPAALVGARSRLQRQLKVSRPDDVYEQAADRLADEVMRLPEPLTLRPPAVQRLAQRSSIQRLCSACEERVRRREMAEDGGEGTLQTTVHATEGATLTPEVEARIQHLGNGQSLSAPVRSFFEPRFGYDFSSVRVHTDAQAGELARDVSARAFTVGHDIVFGAGEYATETPAGRRLLAHELVHVVQQSPDSEVQRLVPDDSARSGPGTTEDIQTRAPMIQRDFAIEPPHPAAVGRALTADEMRDALTFNNRVVGAAGAGVIREIRDVLGITPDPAVVDDDLVNAVVRWQAMQGLTQDGKLGPSSARPLFREIGAEGVGEGRLVSGPTYAPSGTIAPTVAGGRETAHFALRAEFENDPANGIFPSCCEIRQFIRWDAAAAASFGAGGVPHGGFPAGTAADTWIEDRDAGNNRYGHRSGPFTDPQTFDQ